MRRIDNAYDVHSGRNRCHLIPYIGNKSGFAHIFDELVPDDAGSGDIIDVFGGSGAFAIYCSFRFGSGRIKYNDNNPVVANFMECVQNDPDGLVDRYKRHRDNSSGEYFLEVREMDIKHGIDGAGRFLYLAKNAFSGKIRFNGSGKFNAPMRKGARCPKLDEGRLRAISSAIRDMEITCKPFQEWGDTKKAFMYLDPPYMNNTNAHYNMVPSTESFAEFVEMVTPNNRVMISEYSEPGDIEILEEYDVYDVLLRRSLQYATQNDSREIIAINYKPDRRPISRIMSQTARSGFRNEDWVAAQFNNHDTSMYGAEWLKVMEYENPKKVSAQTSRRLGFHNKAHVLVLVDDNVEWVSVKKFAVSFNQLDKHWLKHYVSLWKMPKPVERSLKKYCGEEGSRPVDILEQATSVRDPRRFYMTNLSGEEREQVLTFLNKNKARIIRNVMAGHGRAAARWLLVVEERKGMPLEWAIVSMAAAIRHYSAGHADITDKGNLKLGRITIQRKGGDGGKKTAQMLQFKFSPREVFDIKGAHTSKGIVSAL